MSKTNRLFVVFASLVGSYTSAFAVPVISNLRAQNITNSSADILWDTDTPSDSIAWSGDSNGRWESSARGTDLMTSHKATLINLVPGQTYNYWADSKAGDGSIGTAGGDSTYSFKTLAADPNKPFDFFVDIDGPQEVVQGYPQYLHLNTYKLNGNSDATYLHIDGLPAGTTIKFILITGGSYSPFVPTNILPYEWKEIGVDQANIVIQTAASAPVGDYDLKFNFFSNGITHVVNHKMKVRTMPVPLNRTPVTNVPPIPNLGAWESNMKKWGLFHCDEASINNVGIWEGWGRGVVWFYDGMRVYHQIAEYTGDPSWYQCSDYVKKTYRDNYVLINNGFIAGWRVFPHGSFLDYIRTGDPLSKESVLSLARRSAVATAGGRPTDSTVRETAYILQTYLLAERLGLPNDELMQRAVSFGLGDLETLFFGDDTSTMRQPYMGGLMMAALIEYYQKTKDARVPIVIKRTCDWLWENAWMPDTQSFWYKSTDAIHGGAADLNLLIAPAFAWLWQQTGDPVYQQRGDALFVSATTAADGFLSGGKQFSQNYRWSFDYVRWRSHFNADTYVVAGPTKTPIDQLSREYTVTPNGYYVGTISLIVPNGLLTPNSLTWTGGSEPKTFKFTPSAVGLTSISAQSNPPIENPNPLIIEVTPFIPTPAATALTLTGPSAGLINKEMEFTVTPNGIFSGNVTFSDGGKGGRFTPFNLTWTDHSLPRQFHYTPSTAGEIVITIGNDKNLTNPAGLTLTIGAIPVAPTITTQPSDQTAQSAQSATFTIQASGVPTPTFQWRKNGSPISGASASSYTTGPLALSDNGEHFDCIVSNEAGSVTSQSVLLKVETIPVPTTGQPTTTIRANVNPLTADNPIVQFENAEVDSEITIINRQGRRVFHGIGNSWSGKNNSGQPVPSGIYSAHIQSSTGQSTIKLGVVW